MSTRMPILRSLFTQRTTALRTEFPYGAETFDDILSSVPFDVQVGFDIAQQTGAKTKFSVDKNIGVIYPPYDSMWMEWEDCKNRGLWGCYLVRPIDDEASFVDDCPKIVMPNGRLPDLLAICFLMSPKLGDDHVAISPETIGISLNDDGTFSRWALIKDERSEQSLGDEHYVWLIHTVTTSLALMNCKNVSEQEAGIIRIARNGTEKRRNLPHREIRYHTIMLPGGGSASEGPTGEHRHRATALHRVRGHFKTFTAERPLLGQHVGTYWWGWQVRGTPEKGVVVSDYKLREEHSNA